MAPSQPLLRRVLPRRQRGLTLIEFMVSIVLGMIIVAALATLVADQSQNRAEVDRAGRLIENGRYGIRAMADDLQLAGYWGELNGVPSSTALAALPDPCSLVLATITDASQLHIQGYDAPASASVPTCISNQLSGTDILVVRHVDTATTALGSLTAGQYYVQTGLNASGTAFTATIALGDASNFTLLKKDKVTAANVRKMVVRIYYVAKCSVESGGSCDSGDGGNPIPTLKMLELSAASGAAAWSSPVTIAEGIENLQVDYGVDTNSDGAPDGDDVDGSALTHLNMGDVMAVKVYLLARNLEKTPGFTDDKTYALGTAGTITPATADRGYRRHVFVQSVRLVNPSARRTS